MKNKDLVSVIIPCRNSQDTITQALESIINQTYDNLEIIVVDDFSDIKLKNIIKKYMKIDSRIKYFRSDFNDKNRKYKLVDINAGFSARNTGINKSNGRWITFQDSDDISLLNRIEIQLNLAKENLSTQVTINCFHLNLKEHYLKTLDYIKFIKDFNINIIDCKKITKDNLPYITLPNNIWKKIPFRFKTLPFLRKLFFKNLYNSYPGSGNCTLYSSDYKFVKFRHLSERRWPSSRGRGADKDFNFNLATKSKNPIFVNIPLYGWRTPTKFKLHKNVIDYFI
jgi:glycosyltransferase involved in cell wall biosynthesis